MPRLLIAAFLIASQLAAPLAVAGQRSTDVNAVVTANAPLLLKPDSVTPLRVASPGTVLRVLAEEGEWIQVAFRDPQFGDRIGYVNRAHVRIEAPALRPMDLSLPADVPTPPTFNTPAPPTAQPIAQAAAAEAQRTVPQRTRLHPGLKWTGIAFLIWGGITMATGFAYAEDVCYSDFYSDEESCGAFKTGWIGGGAVITAVGGVLLGAANNKRQPVVSNTISIGPQRVQWRVRF